MATRADLEEFLDRIDRGAVVPAFLVTSGRNASVLVHSFLDAHREVLSIPTLFWFYLDWQIRLAPLAHSRNALLDELIHRSSFSSDWYTTGLGRARNETIDHRREAVAAELTHLLHDGPVPRRELFVALHVAYAAVHGIDLADVRCLLQHHHFPLASFGYRFLADPVCEEYADTSPIFDAALADFPGMKVLHSIRNPFDAFNSMLKAIALPGGLLPIKSFYFGLYGVLAGYRDALARRSQIGERYRFVAFEDLHRRTEETMRDLAAFLGIGFSSKLLTSTMGGKLWWGNNPSKPITGADPAMVNERWRQELDERSLDLCAALLNPLAERYGYEPLLGRSGADPRRPLHGETLGRLYYLGQCAGLIRSHPGDPPHPLFWKRYPRLRTKLVEHFWNVSRT